MTALSPVAALPRVRFATPADEDPLIAMVRDLHSESGLRDSGNLPLPLDEDKVRGMIRRAVVGRSAAAGACAPSGARPEASPAVPTVDAEPGHAAIGVIDASGEIEGSVFLSIETTWYSAAPVVVEIWNYVGRPYRKSRNAKTLIAFSKAVASVLRLPLVMAVMSTERQPAKMRLYERNLGCQPFGAFYLYNPTPGATQLPI
jgi:hypothetical protein